MNQGTDDNMDFLLADERTLMFADVADLVTDGQLGVALLYKDVGAPVLDVTTGQYTPTVTEYAIQAVRSEVVAGEALASGGKYQMGDVRYLVARNTLTATPTREDRIVEGTDTYEIVDWRSDPIGLTWRIIARKVA